MESGHDYQMPRDDNGHRPASGRAVLLQRCPSLGEMVFQSLGTPALARTESSLSTPKQHASPILEFHRSHFNLISQDIIKWVHYVREASNEVTIMSCEPTKCPYFCIRLRHWEFFHGTDVLFAWVDSLSGDVVHQVNYLCLEK